MATLLLRGNDALGANAPTGVDEALTTAGSDWLWAVCALYIVSFLGVLVPCFALPENKRVLHYIFVIALLVGSATYFTEASDLGWSIVKQVDQLDHGATRQIFYAKYINWVVFIPATSLAMGLISNLSWTTIFTNITLGWFWVLNYLFAAYTTSVYKWGFFAFGTLAWLFVVMSLLNEGREAAERIAMSRQYMMLALPLGILWLLYPIAVALGDVGNVIGITGSFIFYGVVDVLTQPIFAVALLTLSRSWDYEKLHLAVSEHRFVPDTERSVKTDDATSRGAQSTE